MGRRNFNLSALLLLAMATQRSGAQQSTPEPRAAHHLVRGQVLARTDIAANGSDAQIGEFIGWITRRPIRIGELLRAPALAPPDLVRSGDSVTVRLMIADVSVAREGTATMSGALGARVRVRLDARHSVTGVVAGPELVRLP